MYIVYYILHIFAFYYKETLQIKNLWPHWTAENWNF